MAFVASPTESNSPPILEASLFFQEDHDPPRPQSQRQAHSSIFSSTYAPGFGHEIRNKSKSNNNNNNPGIDRAPSSHSMSSRRTHNSTSARTENSSASRKVRTLPSWIESYEASEKYRGRGKGLAVTRLVHPSPVHSTTTTSKAVTSPSNNRQSHDGWVSDDETETSTIVAKAPERGLFGTVQKQEKGRKWDHVRSDAPIILPNDNTPASTWIPFIKSSMCGPIAGEGLRVDVAFLNELTPGYAKPWRGDMEGEDLENILGLSYYKRRRAWYSRIQHTLLTHPLVPLAFRLTTFVTSVIALSLSCSIHRKSAKRQLHINSSTTIAIIVDVIAMPYIFYVTWLEYTGKPLGLRANKIKISLVLGDLVFIIFESANASLAFDAMTDDEQGACQRTSPPEICRRQVALGAILLIALLAWAFTFTVSILRLVERVAAREDDDDD